MPRSPLNPNQRGNEMQVESKKKGKEINRKEVEDLRYIDGVGEQYCYICKAYSTIL